MKKCVIITNHSYMLWRFRRELIMRIAEECEVVILTPFVGHENDFKKLGIRCIEVDVDRRSLNPVKDLKLMETYKKALKSEKADMVITYSIKPNIYGGMSASSLGIPYFANVQGLGSAFQKKGVRAVVTLLYKIALRKAKRVFFENAESAELFVEKRIIPREKTVVMKGAGINLSDYAVSKYPENDSFRFLYLGRIMKEKGIDELFWAMKELRKKYGDKVVLDIVGFFEDEYKERIEELCSDGVAAFHGFKEDPRPFYERADCVVLPSWHEGMSNVLLEAAAMGRPLITCDIPGCREAVEDGKTGLLCKPKDAESLYSAMCRMADTPAFERKKMGILGRRKMENEFSREKVVERSVKVLLG